MRKVTERMLKNGRVKDALVLYHGGGYDGCFWEWNAFYLDLEGAFHDLGSSGYAGCQDLKKFADNFNDDYERNAEFFNEKNLVEFVDNFNPGVVVGCLRFLAEHTEWDLPGLKCDCCGERVQFEDVHFDDYQSEGGIVITAYGVICEDCWYDKPYKVYDQDWEHEQVAELVVENEIGPLLNEQGEFAPSEEQDDILRRLVGECIMDWTGPDKLAYRAKDLIVKLEENFGPSAEYQRRMAEAEEAGQQRLSLV
jgi:hypothetical protein